MNKDLKKGSSVKSEISPAYNKPMLAVRCFSFEELQAIKIDCFHILKSVDLSAEHKKVRNSVIEKIEEELRRVSCNDR